MSATLLGMPRFGSPASAARRDPARPADSRLIDAFGRVATDLRISLTDRCNLRCSYCMPEEGLDWMDDSLVLTDAELLRLITVAVDPPRRPGTAVHRRRADAATGPGVDRRAVRGPASRGPTSR